MKNKKAETIRSWEMVFPNDTNPHGTMFGGQVMAIMDKIAGIAAGRYAGKTVVTASTEAIVFKRPIRVGDRIQICARVVWVGRTSMSVKVDVYNEDPISNETLHCTTARFNFVALDRDGHPVRVAPLLIDSEEDRRQYELAEFVINQALERKKRIAQSAPAPENE